MKNLLDSKTTISQLRDMLIDKTKIIDEIKQFVLNKDLKILDFTCVDPEGYAEYVDGMRIRNLTTSLQYNIGITILQVKVSKEIDFNLHEHEGQSQTIYVVSGKLLDLENNISFKPNESYFVSKAHIHSIRYFAGTEVVIVYLPRLNSV